MKRVLKKKHKNQYRVFISHSSKDFKLVKKIVNILKENKLQPLFDENIAGGQGFPDQIKNFIAHSHVFVPVITKRSSKRGWVHQEIGYAMALKIPILPITLGQIPGQMLQDLQAIQWSNNENRMKEQLSFNTFDKLIRNARKKPRPLYESAELHEDRTKMMVEYSDNVLSLGKIGFGHVRQKGALSTFHIPDKAFIDESWQKRYSPEDFKGFQFRAKELKRERISMEKHARKKGCSLMIDLSIEYQQFDEQAKYVRLKSLLEFVVSMPPEQIEIVINEKMSRGENLTIVGNWFLAQSVSNVPGIGYQQTIFTRYAPIIQDQIEKFDEEFQSLLKNQPAQYKTSRDYVIDELKSKIDQLSKRIESS
ncbi:toll/interleukin-1 receptor domain-containing protein [bacterium]|nr:toll/interleukin-1 receptor domain-containing protein [bacterium]